MLNQHIQADTKWAWLPESHDLVEENFLSKVSKFGGCNVADLVCVWLIELCFKMAIFSV